SLFRRESLTFELAATEPLPPSSLALRPCCCVPTSSVVRPFSVAPPVLPPGLPHAASSAAMKPATTVVRFMVSFLPSSAGPCGRPGLEKGTPRSEPVDRSADCNRAETQQTHHDFRVTVAWVFTTGG